MAHLGSKKENRHLFFLDSWLVSAARTSAVPRNEASSLFFVRYFAARRAEWILARYLVESIFPQVRGVFVSAGINGTETALTGSALIPLDNALNLAESPTVKIHFINIVDLSNEVHLT